MHNPVKLARENLAVDVIHDDRHNLPDDSFARESIPYTIHLPEHGIATFTYTWVNGAGEAGAAFALYGPGVGDKPIQQRLADRKVSDNMTFAQWEIEGFSMRQDLKFQHADVSWTTPEASIEFHFEAVHPPYSYGSHAQGCPAFTAQDRIEQAGKVTGIIKLPGREIPFESYGHRDHSWGTRRWSAFQFYHWFEGKSEDGKTQVHYWNYLAHGVENVRGYVVKNGVMAEVTAVDTVHIKYDEKLWQQRLEVNVTDELGRLTVVSVNFYAHYPLVPAPEFVLREAAGRATYDGAPGLGWLEVGWPSNYLTTEAP